MRLYDLIRSNKNLVYIDALTDTSYGINEFHQSIAIEDKKAVVFLYTDNMIGSVEVFLNFLQSRFTVSLLSPQLDIQFKLELEQLYQPYYIYDPTKQEQRLKALIFTKHRQEFNCLKTSQNQTIRCMRSLNYY
ncbi:hypothetical protein [Pedobacter sp. NJ-S-72]